MLPRSTRVEDVTELVHDATISVPADPTASQRMGNGDGICLECFERRSQEWVSKLELGPVRRPKLLGKPALSIERVDNGIIDGILVELLSVHGFEPKCAL